MSKGRANVDPALIRRAFHNDKAKALFDEAVSLGWRPQRTGSGHVKLMPPVGDPFPPLIMSTTAVPKGRTIPNTEAILKRWVRQRQEES